MSLYQVQQCLFDYLRAMEDAARGRHDPNCGEGYDLTDEERTALMNGDVSAFYRWAHIR